MKEKMGLSDDNRNLIAGVTFVGLLLFAPLEPYGLLARSIYLVLIPICIWWILKYFGSKWEMDRLSNDRLRRTGIAIIAGILLVGAYSSFTSKYHSECDQYTRSSDGGSECVGDYTTVKGSNKVAGAMDIFLACIAIWLATSKEPEEKVKKKTR